MKAKEFIKYTTLAPLYAVEATAECVVNIARVMQGKDILGYNETKNDFDDYFEDEEDN